MNWCFKTDSMTVWVQTEDAPEKERHNLKITDAAIAVQRFIGKTLKQLEAWLKKRGRYESYYSVTDIFWEQQSVRYWIRRHTGFSEGDSNALSI